MQEHPTTQLGKHPASDNPVTTANGTIAARGLCSAATGQPPGQVPMGWRCSRGGRRGSARPVPAPLLDGDPGTGGEAGSGGCLPSAEGQGRHGGDLVPC